MVNLEPWLPALAILLGSPLVGLVGRFVAVRKLRALAARTETKLDDVLVEIVSRYVPFWFFLAGVSAAHGMAPPLSLSQSALLAKAVVVGWILSVTAAAARFVAETLRIYAEQLSSTAGGTTLTTNLARVAVVSLGVVLVLANLGISITPLITALGVGSLAVALGLQDTLANLFAGIHVVASRKLDVGDWVKLESGHEGVVVDVGWRTTRLRDAQNNYVLVPNNRVSQGIVVNYSHPVAELDAVVSIPLDPSADLERAEAAADAAARSVLADEPEGGVPGAEPIVRLRAFREGVLWIEVRLKAASFERRGLIVHELTKRTLARFGRERIPLGRPVTAAAGPGGGA